LPLNYIETHYLCAQREQGNSEVVVLKCVAVMGSILTLL